MRVTNKIYRAGGVAAIVTFIAACAQYVTATFTGEASFLAYAPVFLASWALIAIVFNAQADLDLGALPRNPKAAQQAIGERLQALNRMVLHLPSLLEQHSAIKPEILLVLADIHKSLNTYLTQQVPQGSPIEQRSSVIESAVVERSQKIALELRSYIPLFDKVSDDAVSVSAATEDAAKVLVARLREIDNLISELFKYLETSGSNEKVVGLIKRIDEQLNHNRSVLNRFVQDRDNDILESKQRLQELESLVSNLGVVAQGVRQIASRINLLSLNATIEAAHAGEAGKGFAVVATEVKALSQQSDKAAADIREGLETLAKAMRENMTTAIDKSAVSQRAGIIQIDGAITDLSENLQQLVAYQRDIITKVHAESQKISAPVIEMMGSVQFQDITRQRLQGLAETFLLATAHLAQIEQALVHLSENKDMPVFIDIISEAKQVWSKTEENKLQAIELF